MSSDGVEGGKFISIKCHSRGVGRVMPVAFQYIGTLEGVSSLTQGAEVCHAIH